MHVLLTQLAKRSEFRIVAEAKKLNLRVVNFKEVKEPAKEEVAEEAKTTKAKAPAKKTEAKKKPKPKKAEKKPKKGAKKQ